MKRKFIDYFSLNLSKKNSIILISIISIAIVFDSTIVRFISYSGVEIPTSSNIGIFIILSLIYTVSGIELLNSIRKNSLKTIYKLPLNLKYFHVIILITQLTIVGIIIAIILQMTIFHAYSLLLLQVSTYLSHISAIVFMLPLLYAFVGWLKSKRNYIIILYAISFALISSNILASLIYIEYYFQRAYLTTIRPHPIHFAVITHSVTQDGELLSSIFDVLSLSSFLVIWIATITLLYQYRLKVGKIKYFVITSIPLIYYLVPLQDYFGNVFSPLVLNSPIIFGVIYVTIFSSTKQIGAFLFSLAFWTASSLVTNERVRNSLLTSAIGMAVLFGSIEIATLQYKTYPPYGLVTEAFMPLGAYLLFVGIFASATGVARDTNLRKEFYKSAKSQLGLLKTIGITQMENELLKEYKPILDRSRTMEKYQHQQLEQEEVKEIIHDVLKEIQSRENLIAKNKSRSNNEK